MIAITLKNNAMEFLKEAREAALNKSFNSAVTLYYKALAVIADWYIFKKDKTMATNHTQRFNILKSKYPLIYRILDKDFPMYQQSYRLKMNKEHIKVLEDDTKKIIKHTGIEI